MATKLISLRLSDDLLREVDARAESMSEQLGCQISRTAAIQSLLSRALRELPSLPNESTTTKRKRARKR